jgi:hypothetical protein
MLFKQGRKYGISMMMCTQNIADIEYKALAQASTWALGKLMTHQDLGKVQHLVKSLPQEEYETIMQTLPKLKACHFAMVSTDVFKGTTMMKARWLYTQHLTLDEDALKGVMGPEVVDYFSDPLAMAPGDDIHFEPIVDRPEVDGSSADPQPAEVWPAATDDVFVPVHGQKEGEVDKDEKVDVTGPAGAKAEQDRAKRFVYIADIKVPQAEGAKVLMSWKNKLTKPDEEVTKVETEYLLLWRLRIKVEVEEGLIPFLSKKVTREENLYVEASRNLPTSGQLMHVEDTVKFSNVITKAAHEIVDLDHNTEFSVVEEKDLPFKVNKVPALTRKEVERIIYNLFGLQVRRARRVIYRVWRFTLTDKKTGKSRFVRIDSVFGKPVSML